MGKPAATGTPSEAKERLLVEAAQKDPGRFGELYELHFERVYAYIARRVRDRDAAEDLTSEVFHRALSSLPRFDWRGIPFAVWLLRIASNLIVDRWKRVAREVIEDPPEQVIEVCPVEVEHRARLFRMVKVCRKISAAWWSCGSRKKKVSAKLRTKSGAPKERSNNCNSAACKICARNWVPTMPKRSLFEQFDDAVQAMLAKPDAPPLKVETSLASLLRVASALRDLPREEFRPV